MTNNMRAQRIRRALHTEYGSFGESDIVDVLADLLHLCQRIRVDFAAALLIANRDYVSEAGEEVNEVWVLGQNLKQEHAALTARARKVADEIKKLL